MNWYVYCNNNPLSAKDPTGLETIGIHGGANGVRSRGGNGGDAMEAICVILEKYAKTNIRQTPDFEYGGVYSNDPQRGVEYLDDFNFHEKNKNLAGWSVGGDAVAIFLLHTKEHFNIVVIDGANKSNLTQKKIDEIAKKTDKLIIINHNKDELDNIFEGERRNLDKNIKMPDNAMNITITGGYDKMHHENKYSEEAVDEVLGNWDRLKEYNISKYNYKVQNPKNKE